MLEHKRFDLLGVRVSAVDLPNACGIIEDFISDKKKAYVCVAPVSTIVSCQEDENYRRVVNGADMVTPDGMPVVWCAKLAGHGEVRRTYGPDLMLMVCERGVEKGYKHFFYGATPEVLRKLEARLADRSPGINVVGRYAPPFRELSAQEEQEIVDKIDQLGPDIVWIGLGSPKQDFWMKQIRGKLNAPVLIGVGAAFDFLSGAKPQAPRWMQNVGLEWFFRLCNEPKRLWKRYLIGNTKFLYFLLRQKIDRRMTSHA